MDVQPVSKRDPQNLRQLATLKLLSRLLGHEMHAQGAVKTIQLSRDELVEIQTTVDLYIEEMSRRQAGVSQPTPIEAPLIPVRN